MERSQELRLWEMVNPRLQVDKLGRSLGPHDQGARRSPRSLQPSSHFEGYDGPEAMAENHGREGL